MKVSLPDLSHRSNGRSLVHRRVDLGRFHPRMPEERFRDFEAVALSEVGGRVVPETTGAPRWDSGPFASPSNGQFDIASLSYSTVISDPIGSPLEVWLTSSGGGGSNQINWDNVQLDAVEVSNVPAPSALLLMASGLVGLVAIRRWTGRIG